MPSSSGSANRQGSDQAAGHQREPPQHLDGGQQAGRQGSEGHALLRQPAAEGHHPTRQGTVAAVDDELGGHKDAQGGQPPECDEEGHVEPEHPTGEHGEALDPRRE